MAWMLKPVGRWEGIRAPRQRSGHLPPVCHPPCFCVFKVCLTATELATQTYAASAPRKATNMRPPHASRRWGWSKAGDGWPSMRSPAEAALALTPSGMPVVAFQGSVMGNDNICQVRKVYDGTWRGVGGNISNCHTLSLATERTGGVVLSYYDTAAGCPAVKRWTAAAGWSAVGGCAGGRNWPGASSVALASDSSPVLVYYFDWDRPTELGSIAFQKINETRSQTSGRLFPSWSVSAGSGLAVLPARNSWPEVAVVLAHGRRKKVPRKSAEAGVYLLTYSWTTGKSWKQMLVAGEDPPSMVLARSGSGLVAGEWAQSGMEEATPAQPSCTGWGVVRVFSGVGLCVCVGGGGEGSLCSTPAWATARSPALSMTHRACMQHFLSCHFAYWHYNVFILAFLCNRSCPEQGFKQGTSMAGGAFNLLPCVPVR